MNACELEIDLFCSGMRVPDSVPLAGVRGVTRTRAGLGSGLEVAIPARGLPKSEIFVNLPVEEAFARASPYRLALAARPTRTSSVWRTRSPADGLRYAIVDERTRTTYPVRLPDEPAWYSRLTSRNVPMNRIGVMQGTYLGIYVNPVCAFWRGRQQDNCLFCTTGANVGVNESPVKQLEDVIETCWAAKGESGVTFVHLNGGYQGEHGIEFVLPYVRAIKRDVGLLVGVQMTPERDFSRYDALIEAGVDHLSFCMEFMDPAWLARICPGKSRVLGQQLYLDAMAYCAERMPPGAVSGEIIAGVEPIDQTLAAIDRITEFGAFPTVCIFRPTRGSAMENWPTPSYSAMRAVMAHVYDACRRHWLPIGAAPNIEVSLVVNPDDTPLLAPRSPAFYIYEAYRRASGLIAKPVVRAANACCLGRRFSGRKLGTAFANRHGSQEGAQMSHVITRDWFVTLLEHAMFVVGGFVLMVLGLGMGVTMVMLPAGLVIGLVGFAMFVGGLFVRMKDQ